MKFLNEEGLQRLWGHIEDKFNKISEMISNVGRNTEEGGEIFNDYENNVAGIRGIKAGAIYNELIEEIIDSKEIIVSEYNTLTLNLSEFIPNGSSKIIKALQNNQLTFTLQMTQSAFTETYYSSEPINTENSIYTYNCESDYDGVTEVNINLQNDTITFINDSLISYDSIRCTFNCVYPSSTSNTITYLYVNTPIANFPYSIGDTLNCDNGFHLVRRFQITNVQQSSNNTDLLLTIEDIGKPGNFQYQGMDGKIEDMDMETDCYFSCPDKPLAGDIIIPGKAMSAAAGEKNKSLGRASFAVGRNNKALQDCGFVAGRDNTAGYCGTGLGRNSDATGEYSTAIGYDANASGDVSFATGQGTHASKKTSTAFNYYTKATGTGSAAFGNQTNSYGDYTFTQGVGTAAGWGNKVPGQIALGKYNKEVQNAVLMVGNGTGSGDLRSNAFVVYEDGRAAIKADPKENLDISTKQYVDKALINNIPIKAQNTHSLYLNKSEGNNIDTSTNYAVVSGVNCKITNSSIASFIAGGQRNEIRGQNSFATGYKNKIYGNGAVAFGDTNTVGQVTIGSDNMATSFDKAANYSAVFGFNNKAQYANQFVIGKYNDNKTNTLFEIGNGTSNSGRKNALEVSTDGVTYTRMSKNEDLDIVATKGYVDNHKIEVDQEFDETSQNAQSGVAINAMFNEMLYSFKLSEVDTLGKMVRDIRTITLDNSVSYELATDYNAGNNYCVSSVLITDENKKVINCDIEIMDSANAQNGAGTVGVKLIFGKPVSGTFNVRVFYFHW